MARDAGTKIDQPSDQEGKGTPAKEELQTQEAAQAAESAKGQTPSEDPGRGGAEGVAEAEKKAKPRRKPAAKKAQGTAAEATGVDKEAAEAGLAEGSTEAPAAPEEPVAEPEAKPRRRRRRKADDAPAEEPTPAPSPQRRGRRDAGELVTVRAQAKFVRTSARKARLVADHVRGKDIAEARSILAFHPRSVAEDWRKLLDSAVANAEHNHDLVGDELRVLNATADQGPTLKRFQPRAMGRATRIRKRTSHLTITLTPKEN
jgi:ribosomal protein L22